MPVRYRKVKRKVVGGEHKGQERFYAVAKSAYVCDLPRICNLISARTAMSNSEVKGIVDAFLWICDLELKNGASVRMGDFGSYRYVLRSEGVEDEKTFTAHNIRGAKIVFTPGTQLRTTTANLQFEVENPFVKEVDTSEPNPFPDNE